LHFGRQNPKNRKNAILEPTERHISQKAAIAPLPVHSERQQNDEAPACQFKAVLEKSMGMW
jgi:hypothetical protein